MDEVTQGQWSAKTGIQDDGIQHYDWTGTESSLIVGFCTSTVGPWLLISREFYLFTSAVKPGISEQYKLFNLLFLYVNGHLQWLQ
jgi:hypothetical protein